MIRHWMALTLLGLIVLNSGCNTSAVSDASGGAAGAKAASNLKALGQAYIAHHDTKKKGPASWDEAMEFGDAAAISALRDEGYLVAWDVRFRDAKVGVTQFVIAMPANAKTEGGYVLFLDGSVILAKAEPLNVLLEAQADVRVPE